MRALWAAVLIGLAAPAFGQFPPGVPFVAKREGTNAALRDEIMKMHEAHLDARASKDPARIKQAEARHVKRLKEIVAKHGWPTETMVGEHGASAAWLMVHHAESDPDFQRRVLELMEPLVPKKEANGQLYAYLYDRTHKPQRFGTQGSCVGPNQWQPRAIDEPARVEERRREMGLMPEKLVEYAAIVSRNCK
jgi:hypothetical protein